MMWLNRKGFTLVEIMIVVAIIGLLAAIAIPNFMQARTTARLNACRNNLRVMSGAIEQWALETNQADSAAVGSDAAILLWEVYIKGDQPDCPGGGTYAIHLDASAAAATDGTLQDYVIECSTHGTL